jgi:hypothetical protein
VIKEYADLLRSYGIGSVMGDNWGGGLHADEWVRNRIEFRKCPYDKSENYLRSLPLLMAKRGLLLDHAKQRLQLAGLERRVSGGHESIGHAQTASAHDDISDAVCGVLVVAANREQEPPIVMPGIYNGGREISAPRVLSSTAESSTAESEQPVDGAVLANQRRPPDHYLKKNDEPWRPFVDGGYRGEVPGGVFGRPLPSWWGR